jgi:hypothetical protein
MSSVDLFELSIPAARLHPNYAALYDSPFHAHARAFMNDIYRRMGDPNGNFRRDFQEAGFHARVFELAVFAYLESAGFHVDHSHNQPDFLASQNELTICIEATTANPPDGHDRDVSVMGIKPLSEDQLHEKVYREFPRRVLSSLNKKLRHHYHDLQQCIGRPLVIAAAPYFEPGSVTYTDEALVDVLYGCGERHGKPVTKTPFFLRPQTRAISAVMFTNQFTVPRFYRLGATYTGDVAPAIRSGFLYQDHGGPTHSVGQYRYLVGDPSVPVETWQQGVTMFLNPYAARPLALNNLPCSSIFFSDDDGLHRLVRGLHTVTSFMEILR